MSTLWPQRKLRSTNYYVSQWKTNFHYPFCLFVTKVSDRYRSTRKLVSQAGPNIYRYFHAKYYQTFWSSFKYLQFLDLTTSPFCVHKRTLDLKPWFLEDEKIRCHRWICGIVLFERIMCSGRLSWWKTFVHVYEMKFPDENFAFIPYYACYRKLS